MWTHYVGNRSTLKAVERARISYSDGVTSSSAFHSHWLRDGFGESSFFSEFTAMSGRIPKVTARGQDCTVMQAAARQRVFLKLHITISIPLLACCYFVLRTTSASLPSFDPSSASSSCSPCRRTHACNLRRLLARRHPLEIRPLHTRRSSFPRGSREGRGLTHQGMRAGKSIGSGTRRPDRCNLTFAVRGRSVR
jgi:hypothetical protein